MEPATPTKSRKAHMFTPNVILDSPNICANLKRLVADSFSLFGDLFLTRKSIRGKVLDPQNHLQVCLTECQRTKNVKIKGMNHNAKSGQ